ncbi:MAG: Rrf2 family transcriptional regulator [Phycisphaerae bacterium]|nr:Rrf2 family transcriptional regulator [Phycisphaerae bacterium]
MKLTTKSEYSILALLYLTRQTKDHFVKVDEIVAACDIPKKYLEFLLMTLRQHRLIKTRRGKQGGYQLAQPAGQISLASVIRLMDGALAPTESVSTYFHSDTPLSKEPNLLAVFQDIRDYISDKLEKLTLKDLI